MNKKPSTIRKKNSKFKYCSNVNEEFCKRTLSLLFSFYDDISLAEINNFPPVEPEKENKKLDKQLSMNTAITDLRLKRLQVQKNKDRNMLNEEIDINILQATEMLRSSDVNDSEMFELESVERPSIPKFVQDAYKEDENLHTRKANLHDQLDLATEHKKFQKKLESAHNRGVERAQRRFQRLTGLPPPSTKEQPKQVNKQSKDKKQSYNMEHKSQTRQTLYYPKN